MCRLVLELAPMYARKHRMMVPPSVVMCAKNGHLDVRAVRSREPCWRRLPTREYGFNVLDVCSPRVASMWSAAWWSVSGADINIAR
jgi:hypothetical protein